MLCRICNKELTTGVSSHLSKKHKLSFEEYISRYPGDRDELSRLRSIWLERKNTGIRNRYKDTQRKYETSCKLCGKGLTLGVAVHLGKTHSLSVDDYIKLYPSEAEKISQLYNTWRNKDSKSHKGKKFTAEHRRKLQVSHKEAMQKYKGQNNPAKRQEVRAKISSSKRRKYATGEQRVRDHRAGAKFREDLGLFFRSRWEANIARCFDLQSIEWRYEPKAFVIDNSGVTYTPDFYLPELAVWLEVKGYMDVKGRYKISQFRIRYPNESLLVIKEEEYREILLASSVGLSSLEDDNIVRALLKNKEVSRNDSLVTLLKSLEQ